MFTGIIESQAVLKETKKNGKQVRLTFSLLGQSRRRFRSGESVAVDGTCVSVSAFRGKRFTADLIPETLRATTLGGLRAGQRVNVERALRVGDSLGGHWISGHVDGLGYIREIKRQGESFRLRIETRPSIIQQLIHKGSIAVDGISFTLQEIRARSFIIGVIPHTFRVTTLPWKRIGDPVNLEVDQFAKLARRFFTHRHEASVRERDLRRQGF